MDSTLNVSEAYARALKILGDKNTKTSELGEAIQGLQQLRENGWTSAQLEANLGRAYGRLENWSQAIFHFEEALKIDRWNSTLRADLQWVQEKIPNDYGTPLSHPSEWGYSITTYVRSHELLLVFFACLWVLLLAYYRKRHLHPKVWIPSAAVLLVLLSGSLLSLSAKSLAIVEGTSDALVRSAPLKNAEELAQLKPGTRLKILRTSGAFSEVERPKAFRGWIESRSHRPVASR